MGLGFSVYLSDEPLNIKATSTLGINFGLSLSLIALYKAKCLNKPSHFTHLVTLLGVLLTVLCIFLYII
jgi:hypothetical protein